MNNAAQRWPIWRTVVAYVVMTALAIASIWFIDRKVHRLPAKGGGASSVATPTSE